VVGIDLDGDLIIKCQKHLRRVASLMTPEEPVELPNSLTPTFTNNNMLDVDFNYFPVSMSHLFGNIPFVADDSDNRNKTLFPYNVLFKQLDIVSSNAAIQGLGKFHSIILFSVTKWVHLNYGDAGITKLFQTIYYLLHVGGELWIEPQGYDTYSKHKWIFERAAKKNATLTLDILPFEVESDNSNKKTFWSVLESIGFKGHVCKPPVAEGHGDSSFEKRPIWRFVK
jgi:7SK snRNA methylphosphate capping enzyme